MKLDKDAVIKHFALLKLKSDADLDELKQAYKKRVKFWHPDKFPSSSERLQKMAHDKLHEVNVAYKQLGKYIQQEAKKSVGDNAGRRKTDKDPAKTSRETSKKSEAKTPPESPPPPAGFYDRKDRWEAEPPKNRGPQEPSQKGERAKEPQPKVSYDGKFHNLPNGDKYAGGIVNNQPHGDGIYFCRWQPVYRRI